LVISKERPRKRSGPIKINGDWEVAALEQNMATRKSKTLRLGIIGTGWPGQMHAIAACALETAQIYACADVDETRRAEFQKEYAPQKAFGDYHDLLADDAVDAAIICLPNHLHFPATLTALEAGKHVLCEKPPTMTGAEMKVLREEAAKRNLVYFFSRQYRFTPGMQLARSCVEKGRLGQIYHATATFVRSRGIPSWGGGWFTDRKRSGGGALIDIGIHALDAVWFLMGTPRPTAVSARVFRNFAHLVEVPVFDVEDAAYAFIRFDNGAVVQMETSWAGNLTDEIPPREVFGQELINSVLYGTKASIRLNPLAMFEDRKGELVKVDLKPETTTRSPFELQLQNFVEAVRGEAKAVNDADQAVALMEMIDAIYASSELGREVPIAQG
jgi:predicted dehydrogenase